MRAFRSMEGGKMSNPNMELKENTVAGGSAVSKISFNIDYSNKNKELESVKANKILNLEEAASAEMTAPPSKKAAKNRWQELRAMPRKALGYALLYAIYAAKRLWERDVLIVSPAPAPRPYGLWKLTKMAGIRMVAPEAAAARAGGRRPLAVFRHHDATWDPEPVAGSVNGRCTDISKSHVDRVFEQVFGYGTRLDPTRFQGRAVMKPELNAQQGGVFVQCPLPPEAVRPDHIYQRLVDNAVDAETVKEWRVVVIGGELVDVTVQLRTIRNRLTGRGSGGGRGFEIKAARDVFSAADIERILRFCDRLGLEYGELDILPDLAEDRIYIVDANSTPSFMTDATAFRWRRFEQLARRTAAFKRFLHARRADLAPESR
jgi:hypothetical protein